MQSAAPVIPAEVLQAIFVKVSLQQLGNLRLVSHFFKDVMQTHLTDPKRVIEILCNLPTEKAKLFLKFYRRSHAFYQLKQEIESDDISKITPCELICYMYANSYETFSSDDLFLLKAATKFKDIHELLQPENILLMISHISFYAALTFIKFYRTTDAFNRIRYQEFPTNYEIICHALAAKPTHNIKYAVFEVLQQHASELLDIMRTRVRSHEIFCLDDSSFSKLRAIFLGLTTTKRNLDYSGTEQIAPPNSGFTNLAGAFLTNANCTHLKLICCNLENAQLYNVTLGDSHHHSNFENAVLYEVSFLPSQEQETRSDNTIAVRQFPTNLQYNDFRNTRFEKTDLSFVDVSYSKFLYDVTESELTRWVNIKKFPNVVIAIALDASRLIEEETDPTLAQQKLNLTLTHDLFVGNDAARAILEKNTPLSRSTMSIS